MLDAGPAGSDGDEDQCWTLARIAELVWRRLRVGYTLAGLDLLNRPGEDPARRAAERDEAWIAAWLEETGWYRTAADLEPTGARRGGDGDRRQQ